MGWLNGTRDVTAWKKRAATTARRLLRVGVAGAMVSAVWLSVGCSRGGALTPRSGGRPFEVLVVADRDSLLATALSVPVPGLPQEEPMFDVSTATELDRVNRVARTVVVLRVDSTLYNKVKLRYERDRYASPQLVVTVGAPSVQALRHFLAGQAHLLTDLLTAQELSLGRASLQQKHNDEATQAVRRMFGVELLVPSDLTAMKRGDGFLWLSDDGRAANRSLCVYCLPKACGTNAAGLSASFAHGCDSVLRRNLPGERQGMYVQTASAPLLWQENTADGQKRTTVRGLWEMRGDGMGGPFVATLLDRGDRWLVAEAFVYAPGTKKRNRLRQLEAALSTASSVRNTGGAQ